MSWKSINTTPEKKEILLVIEEKDQNKTILEVLKSYLKYYQEDKWKEILENNIFTINNQKATINQILKIYDEIYIAIDKKYEPKIDENYKIIFEDENILVINKPANLPVHPSGRYYANTLINLLKKIYKELYIINRLDKETSGIVILAKNKMTAQKIAKQFENRLVKKEYIAIVKGKVDKEYEINKPLLESNWNTLCKIIEVNEKGKESLTIIKPIKVNQDYSIVKAIPKTGRTHQIRVHLKEIGYPVIGDKLYEKTPQEFLNALEDKEITLKEKRQMLHCHKLTIIYNDKEKEFVAEMPSDMQKYQ